MIGYSNEHLEERVALLYTAGHLGGAVSPQVGPGQSPGGDWVMPPENIFCLCLQHRTKLAPRKNEIIVLFCTTSAKKCLRYIMFTIHQIRNSSLVYVKHVFLDISIKGRFESNKYLLFIKSKTPPFIEKMFFFTFL